MHKGNALVTMLLAAVVLLLAAFPVLGQESGNESPADETDGESSASVASLELESPFLQDDLDLLVGNVQRPNGFVWHDNSLYTVCNGDWTIYKIDDRSGDTITFVFGTRDGNMLLIEDTSAGFDILVPDPDNSTVWKVDQSRSAPVRFTTSIEAPWGIARLDAASYLITDVRTNSIIEVAEHGANRGIQSELRAPTGIVRYQDKVYFANGGSARRGIEYFDIYEDGDFSGVKPLVSGLQNTSNLVLGGDGKLYFAYALGTRGVVGRIDPAVCHESGCSNSDVELVVFSDIPAPLAITLSDDLRLFLHSRFRPEIYWLQLPT